MVDILHRIGATAPVTEAYAALSTIEGLARWWTEDTTGDPSVGGVIRFRFEGAPGPGGFDMLVRETRPDELVRWEVVDGEPEWIGTEVRFDLKQEGEHAIVLFQHRGWREPVEFMYHCSSKWGVFLMSLKKLLETGAGDPAPRDIRVSNWH